MSYSYYGFAPYVSVAERRRKAQVEMAKLSKQGKKILPVKLEGRKIASSFWGKAWCDNLESYMDYENRLPRGRTYVRNGSVVHLEVKQGRIEAIVSGSELYHVSIGITQVAKKQWETLCKECAGGIGSLIELLQGRLSSSVMDVITRKQTGLFPAPAEIKLNCSCPDSATMCKHVAAVLYGVGARLDHSPDLLFVLRSVNHEELITQAASATDFTGKTGLPGQEIAESEMGSVFGIDMDTQPAAPAPVAPAPVTAPAQKKPLKKIVKKLAKKPVAKTKSLKSLKSAKKPVKKSAVKKKK